MTFSNVLAPLAFCLLLASCGPDSDTSTTSADREAGSGAPTTPGNPSPSSKPEGNAVRGPAPNTSTTSTDRKAGSTAPTSALKPLPGSQPEENTALRNVEINYTWEGGSNRCNGATALSDGVLIAAAQMKSIGGDRQSGYYVEVEEVHYAPGTQEVTYRGTLRFRIGPRGTKIAETPISGEKQFDVFREWPMGR